MAEFNFNDGMQDVRDKAAAVVIRLGGVVSPRILAKHLWRYRVCPRALLQTMADRDYGQWVNYPPGPKGGRPSTMFAINDETIRRIGETYPLAVTQRHSTTTTSDIGETEMQEKCNAQPAASEVSA